MCLIAGGFNVSREDAIKIINLGKHRGPDSFGFWSERQMLKSDNFSDVSEIEGGEIALIQCRLAMTGSKSYTQPFYNEIILVHNGEIYNHESLRKYLIERGVAFETDVDSEVILRLLEYLVFDRKLKVEEAIKLSMKMLRGDYAVAFFFNGKFYLFRDPLGVRPLYYSSRGHFASEKKVLWGLGEDAEPVLPGEIVSISKHGITRVRGFNVFSIRTQGKDYFNGLQNLLIDSVKVRASKKVGVLFSGGVDSSLIALIASRYSDVILYTSGTEDSKDVEWARRVAEELGLKLRESLFSREDIENEIERIMFAIEEPNPMNLAIAIPLYFSTKRAREDGVKVLLSGQGADELFGGYAKYLQNPGLMLKDVEELGERNLARDDKVAMLNGVETRYPYLDLPFAILALNVPLELKIRDGKRKFILREIAKSLGLPEWVAEREKKAAQYGSNAQKILEKIAKSRGVKLKGLADILFSKVFHGIQN
ncbi:asparagine synthase (glutamine-hydrolyzing) [Pyrococcus abyssi]|uniref:Putative asparagine synthetase [glutamine-hydrolyzing] n=1 Tax=Pyrococcus abyssi (strain GE5 / Orsay) TaxID=272844 RepID=Q9UZL3_PYRAB|nr:asparagine synthase (glutamine-hydrolyzing) [Pyrococcus abyssi]CAB50044.1 Asparagine synthase (glutamine-hydrolyzing) (EC 6.3.5.4) [Pyrococcus abyssi GE5]CCE70548.1 TPA: asparagine synthetase, putative [Pyrococcus abyssi GE5]